MTEPTPWYSERWFVWSGVFLALLLVVGAAMALTGGGSTSAGRVTTAARPVRGLVPDGGSRCGLPVGPTDKPVGPPDATWRLVGTMAVPSSPVFGPGIDRGHQRVCFAHSPTGALFAAVSFLAAIDDYGNDATAMRDIAAETHARNVLLKQQHEPPDPAFRAQVAGFRVTVASRDLVIVDLAVQTNIEGRLVVIACPMRWEQRPNQGGDWRFMITNVDRPYSGAALDDLSGMVRWSGA